MPSEYSFMWYCGWCGLGPLSSISDIACCVCHRRRDEHCRVEDILPYRRSDCEAGPNPGFNPQPEIPGWRSGLRSGLAANTKSVRSRAALKGEAPSPAKLSANQFPANSVPSKDSNAVIDAGNGNSGLASNDLVLPSELSSCKERTEEAGVNRPKDNLPRIGSIYKQSRLNDYLAVKSEDPWNQEWVVYTARTPLPGEASYLLETGEPATTSRRRPYDQRRRAEVAFTRNNGGACEPCRRRHRACRHRLRERSQERLQKRLQDLEAVIEGDETASEQLREGGVTQRATDAVRSDVAASIGPSSQRGDATSHVSFARGRLSFRTPRREPSQRPPTHRRPSAGPSEHLALARSQSQRRQTSHSSSALVDELGIRPGRLPIHDGSGFLRPPPARRSAWNGQGINAVSGSSGSSRHSGYVTIRHTNRDFAASTPVEERYSLGFTQRGAEELSYMSDGAGLRSFPPLPYSEQQSLLSEQMSATQPGTLDTASNQRTTLPYEGFTWNEVNYANMGRTRARSSNVTDPPRSSSRNHIDQIPVGVIDESSSPVLRPSETTSWPLQLASFGRDDVNEHSVGSIFPIRESSLPQTPLDDESMSVLEDQQAILNLSDGILDWQIDNGLLFDAGPPEEIFDNHDATQLPPAIAANLDIDLAAVPAWDDLYDGEVDPSVGPPLESYASYLGDPIFTDSQGSTSGSNREPIPTPPSDETG